MQRKRRIGVFTFSILAAAASYAEAGNTIYWFGDQGGALDTVNSGDSNWSTSQTSNVDYGQAPQAGDNLVFSADGAASANVAVTPTPAAGTTVTTSFYGSMTVMGNQPAITLSGSSSQFLNLGNITVANGAGNLAINTRMYVDSDRTWETDNGSTLTIGGEITGVNTPNLTLAGNGTITITGTIGRALTSAVFVHVNSGATFNPKGSFSNSVLSMDGGNFYANGGAVVAGWIVGDGGGKFLNLNGGVLDMDFGGLLTSGTYGGTFDNNVTDLAIRSVNSPGTYKLTGSSSYTGRTLINQVTSAKGATIILAGGDNRLPVGSALSIGTGFSTPITSKLQLGDDSGPVNQTFSGLTGAAVSANNLCSIVGGNALISRLTCNNSTTFTYAATLGGSLTNENNLALTKSNTGILNLSGTNTYVGDTTVTGGTLNMTGLWTNCSTYNVNALTGNAALLVGKAGALPASAAVTATSSASFVPTIVVSTAQTFTSLTSSGSISFTSGASTVGTIDGTGTLSITTAGTSLTANYVRQSALSIGASTTVTLSSKSIIGAAVSNVSKLTVNATGTLDVNNNDLIVNHANPDTTTLANVRSAIVQAYHGGAWDQPGITSSLLPSRPKNGLGYAEASALGTTSFDGQSVTDAVLVKYTLLGDGNLDSVVNALDFNMLASNYGASSNALWTQGDFNYDGTVNTPDFVLLAGNFGAPLSAPVLSSVVPEPVMLGAAALSLAMLSQRRRRA
jgi:fibronectin-binding autotransporter adhesin